MAALRRFAASIAPPALRLAPQRMAAPSLRRVAASFAPQSGRSLGAIRATPSPGAHRLMQPQAHRAPPAQQRALALVSLPGLGSSRSHPLTRLQGSLPRASAALRAPAGPGSARGVHATRVLSQRGWEHGHTGVIREIERFTGREFQEEWVVYAIIAANCVVFLLWQNDRLQRFMYVHCTVSSRGVLRDGYLHTLFTHFWSHHSSGHLLGNMFTLWFFGTELVGMLGVSTFLKVYLGGGLISGVCQVAWPYIAKSLPIPARYRDQTYFRGLGASGAINAVVAFSIMTFPARIILVWFILPVPSAALGMIFLGKDLVGMYQGNSEIANAAHVAGTAWGAAWWYLLRHRIGLRTW